MADSSLEEVDTLNTTISYLFSGTLSGAAGVTVSHPLDTVRIRMAVGGSKAYSNGWQCFRSTVKREGYRALFKGVTWPLAGIGLQNAILFGTYGPTLELLHAIDGGAIDDNERLTNVFIAGCVGGGAQTLVCTPLELLKIRMQLHTDKALNPLGTARRIIRVEGVRALYHGFVPTFVRDFPSYGVWFVAYAAGKRAFIEQFGWGGSLTPVSLFFAGGLAGVISWGTSYPFDFIKTRVQSSRSMTVRSVIQDTFRTSGWRGFFHGYNTTLIRGFVCSGTTLLAVEAGLFITQLWKEDRD